MPALLAANADAIARACDALDRAARAGIALPPAGERLLAAYPLLDTQLRLAHTPLAHAARRLPADAMRAWRLVLDVVARGDGRVDADELAQALADHQQSGALQVAELDALPAFLRLALLDKLRRLAARAAQVCSAREQAAGWAARFVDTAESRPGDLVLLVADMARSTGPDDASFVAELARRLYGRGAALAQVLDWIDARLADGGNSIAAFTAREQGELVDDGVCAGNSLASLRLMKGVDWHAFAEALGAVDAVLRDDPDGSYARMDGATRDRYRHTVARLARSARVDEAAVAQQAVALAGRHRAPGEGGLDVRTRHVGHYLVGPGLPELEAAVRRRAFSPRAGALGLHIGATALLSLAFTLAIVLHARHEDAGALLLVLIGLLALPGASQLARALVRMMGRWLATPTVVPRMDVGAGIPDTARTVVAVSARLVDAAQLAVLGEDLEVRYLGNRDPNLRFCLLLDLPDAAHEEMPDDAALLAQARDLVDALNRRYGGAAREPFMLLVRPRSWSLDQGAWIGRERRRGQLVDLTAWLCGARARFLLAAGNTGAAAEMRYVIALDAGCGLPKDAARSLVAAMTHPLHLPLQDDGGQVVAGHGMLVPDTGPVLPGRGAPRLGRLFSSGGNGWAAIYDIDAWRRAVGDTLLDDGRAAPGLVEEDRLRAGRVRDLRLDALYPVTFGEQTLRRHRALRAAWQDARRLGRGTHGLGTGLARWRLFDTLRAALVAPASVALLLLGWSMLADPGFWTAAVLAVAFAPAFVGTVVALCDRPADAPWRQHLDGWVRDARVALARAALSVAFLPHTAWIGVDALVRGLWRRDVTRRQLLELRPATLARTSRALDNNWRAMWFAPLLAVGSALLLTFANPYALFATAPLLLVWFLSPVLAWWFSQPAWRGVRLGSTQTQFLRALARRSWAFFEQHGAAVHGLAPRAVAEHPAPFIDTRISPDGIGLALLANLGARDFGFIAAGELLVRSEAALASVALLERWNGHLFGAYDGATLGPVEPARVDTAASGALVLALRTFAAGLDELPDQPVIGRAALDGVRAAILVVREHADSPDAAWQQVLTEMDAALAPERGRAIDTLPGLHDALRAAAAHATRLDTMLPDAADPVLRAWVARLAAQCEAQLQELYALAPWMRAAQEYVLDARLTRIPTLRELAALESSAQGGAGLAQLVDAGRACAEERVDRLAALAAQARDAAQMDFSALVDPETGVLAAGCQVRDARLDSDSCDLLASDARMASFAAVAQDQLPQQHWWSLGRPQRMAGGSALLLSHSGAMSDYLLPQVLMPTWQGTLLGSAGGALVRAQAAFARAKGVLWGFSASGSNAVDAAARYRFGDFGLPAAALQRRRDDDLVAAPYAAALALGVAPGLAATNLQSLAKQGMTGEIGMFDALDYAPARLPQGERQAVVRIYVGRHQAATLLALAGHLLDEPMQRRFSRDPEWRCALGLLHEPVPVAGAAPAARYDAGPAATLAATAHPYARVIGVETAPRAETQLLSNGRYHLVLDSDGAGASRWDDVQIASGTGMVCLVRDTADYRRWSNTLLPTLAPAHKHDAVFAEGRASFRRVDGEIEMVTDVVVAPDDDVELRRIRITNRGAVARTLELGSSVTLAGPALQAGRSGVNIEWDAANDSLLCVTAPDAPVIVHRMVLRGAADAPQALVDVEAEPDVPVLALGRTVTLGAGQDVTIDLVLGVAPSRAVARELAARYAAGHVVDHAIEAAWTHGQAFLRRIDVTEPDVQLYTRLAGYLLQPAPVLCADPAVIARNVRTRADLAPYGVSGALPLLLLQLGEGPETGLARQVAQAHTYWRSRGLDVDLVVLCASHPSQEAFMHVAAPLLDPAVFDAPGGVHLHLRDDVPQEDRILLRSAAHVLLLGERGDLADQLRRAARPGPALPPPLATVPAAAVTSAPVEAPALQFDNGIGGFTADGSEYIVRSSHDTPAPWDNLLANAVFGSRVSHDGHAVSWSGQDDARVTGHEAFYLRDEDSGAFWSPTPWPAPSGDPYVTRHGIGYTMFEHATNGIHSTLRCFVAREAALKYSVITLRNDGAAPRRLTVNGYVDWQLDAVDAIPGLQVVTGVDLASGALYARNAFGAAFRDQVGFFHVDAEHVATTCDRLEFVGRHGNLAGPAAFARAGLSGADGAGLDPCAALQVAVTLAPGAACELVFVLGVAGPGILDASRAAQQHGGAAAAHAAWDSLRAWWAETLDAVQVSTPDASFDLRVNRWLPYQAITGMFGERCTATRLQAALACAHARPELLRDELLRAARAFAAAPAVEDFLWLPYALTHYLAVTGDQSVLAALPFDATGGLAARDDLYQACVHGLRGSLRFGQRGLPLAAGRLHDDEDSDRVESVRLGFFMTTVLQRFADVADRRGDFGFATTCRGAALALAAQCEEHGWDGDWYRWTWLGGLTALGSIANAACRIELSTQAWAVMAGAARAPEALRAAGQRLVDHENGAISLCDPPVDGQWSERVAAHPGQDHRATAWAAAGFARLDDPGRAWQLAGMLDPLARPGAAPYAMPGGVRTIAPHPGRALGDGGAAAAAWTWIALVEGLLGLERHGNRVRLRPHLAPGWDGLHLRYRHRGAYYEITVRAVSTGEGLLLDGQPCADWTFELADDRRDHRVELRVAGTPPGATP